MIKKLISLSLLLSLTAIPVSQIFSAEYKLPSEDRQYLETLMKATWDYCDYYIAPKTGFPYDSNTPAKDTNTTNIGLYLADLAVAHHLGYVTKEHAIARASKILESLKKIENWDGLYKNILDTEGETKAKPGESNISDYNKLPAGVIMIKQEFPELNKECSAFLNRINWSIFYAPSIDGIYYAYDVVNRKPLGPVHISRGEDKLLGAFMTVATGGVPASTWDHHIMDKETKYGLQYLTPGWQGGGLFMQFICGIFLDERGTALGYSSANFAFAHIIHAEYINSPVWGWSASCEPDGGYIGVGSLKDEVVTPHASALAIEFFPEQAIRNLKRLDKLGARPKQKAGGKEWDFGFRDSFNTLTGRPTQSYLVLDQSMLFLSLANFLKDDIVRKTFAKDPVVQNGYRVLKPYHISPSEKKKFSEYLSSLTIPVCSINVVPKEYKDNYNPGETIALDITVNNFTATSLSSCRLAWKFTDSAKGTLIASGDKTIDLLKGTSIDISNASCLIPKDISRKSGVSFEAALMDSKGKELKNYDLSFALMNYFDMRGQWLFQTGDSVAWSASSYNDVKWKKITVPGIWEDQGYEGYGGYAWYRHHFKIPKEMLAEWGKSDLVLEFGSIDDADQVFLNGTLIGTMGSFPPKPETAYGKPRVYAIPERLFKPDIDNIIAVRIHDSGGNGGIYKGPVKIAPSSFSNEEVMNMGNTDGWDVYTDNNNVASIKSIAGRNGKAMEFTYNLTTGQWAAMRKYITADLSKYSGLAFSYRGSGNRNCLEIKLEDADGSVFGQEIKTRSNPTAWTDVVIPFSSLSYWWGGDQKLDLKKIKLHFALAKKDGDMGGSGKVVIGRVGAFSGTPAQLSPQAQKPELISLNGLSKGKGKDFNVLKDLPADWDIYKDATTEVTLAKTSGKTGDALELSYDFKNGKWFGARKTIDGDISVYKSVRFTFRGSGETNTIEMKLEDKDGSNFGRFLPIKSNIASWSTLEIPFSALEYWSGGDNKLDLSSARIHFAVSIKDDKDKGGKGKLAIGNIEFIK